MEYFHLSISKTMINPITFSFLPSENTLESLKKWDFSSLVPMSVAFFDPRKEEEVPDLLISPTFLCSDKLKDVFMKYWELQWKKEQFLYIKEEKTKGNEDIILEPDPEFNDNWCGIQLVPPEQTVEEYPRYWFLKMEVVNCVHESAEFYPNKMLKRLVLDRSKMTDLAFFKVGNLIEHRVIVNLELAEKILQVNPLGVSLTKVEVR